MLTDFTPGGLVTEYTVSQNSLNRIALKISTFLFCPKSCTPSSWAAEVFYHARPVWLQLATVCKFWQRLYHAWLPFLKGRQHLNQQKIITFSHCIQKLQTEFSDVINSCHGTANLKSLKSIGRIWPNVHKGSQVKLKSLKVRSFRIFSKWSYLLIVFVIKFWSVRSCLLIGLIKGHKSFF